MYSICIYLYTSYIPTFVFEEILYDPEKRIFPNESSASISGQGSDSSTGHGGHGCLKALPFIL